MAQQRSEHVYELGLTMAGAISAGAYSAGVLDFLVQALDEWEKALAAEADDALPNHSVVIKVISGASAGSLTGALGAAALAGGLKPEPFDAPRVSKQKYRCVLPTLYRTWVVDPCMVSRAGGPDLLSVNDLQDLGKDSRVPSILDCTLLDRIMRHALTMVAPPAPPVPYIAEKLHIYMTVSNLRGVPYSVKFTGGAHGMMSHGDRVHYIVEGLGKTSYPSDFADSDSGLTLNVASLFTSNTPPQEWLDYGEVALASGAFPLGLSPRYVSAALDAYASGTRKWPYDVPPTVAVEPNWPKPWGAAPGKIFKFLNVDGGLINNEPFEYARCTLRKSPSQANPREGREADRSVILIDPFPEPPDFLADDKPSPGLAGIIGALFPALKNQARFKPGELLLAAADTVYSRYLVAPHRTVKAGDGEWEERYAIACGLLGGFGGFLDEKFRAHDFQLGRRNCQRFLREVFTLPADNGIIQAWPDKAKANPDFQTTSASDPKEFTIIPLFGSAREEVELPPWPQIGNQDFDALQTRIRARLEAIAPKLIEEQSKGVLMRRVLKFALWLGKKKILDYAKFAILSDLIRRDQIEGWDLSAVWSPAAVNRPSDKDMRMVLAELASPAFDYRTVPGLVLATGLSATVIETVLSFCLKSQDRPWEVWCADRKDGQGNTLYALASRKPSLFWRLPGIRNIGDWVSEPAIG